MSWAPIAVGSGSRFARDEDGGRLVVHDGVAARSGRGLTVTGAGRGVRRRKLGVPRRDSTGGCRDHRRALPRAARATAVARASASSAE